MEDDFCLVLIADKNKSLNFDKEFFKPIDNIYGDRCIIKHEYLDFYVFIIQIDRGDNTNYPIESIIHAFQTCHPKSEYGLFLENFLFWGIVRDWLPDYPDLFRNFKLLFGYEYGDNEIT